jgi:hypothetical protein
LAAVQLFSSLTFSKLIRQVKKPPFERRRLLPTIRRPHETILPAYETALQQWPAIKPPFPAMKVVHQMFEAVAILMVLFWFGIFVIHAVEGYPMAGDWLARIRAVNSMYRPDSQKTD